MESKIHTRCVDILATVVEKSLCINVVEEFINRSRNRRLEGETSVLGCNWDARRSLTSTGYGFLYRY